eukprot:CAMPEP_0115874386 /NCGR_PEP_ID=MMETSP0287-20121206/24512_1 /TAXON_ID=412157 /ORGANISM="Chrysochromulina rotalis, Strain UIO044" /LENGTH=58 /DNA_ID=CAMNT_0003329531 /DNA_START=5 /DNA_END=181 /DNA_ORIENTATION=-
MSASCATSAVAIKKWDALPAPMPAPALPAPHMEDPRALTIQRRQAKEEHVHGSGRKRQ